MTTAMRPEEYRATATGNVKSYGNFEDLVLIQGPMFATDIQTHLYDRTLIKCCLLTTFMTVSAGLQAYFDNRGSMLSIYAKKQ